jgi:6-phosphogluconolactonase
MVSPDGDYLMAANQDTDNIVTFRLDPASGRLIATGIQTPAPTPVCVRVL